MKQVFPDVRPRRLGTRGHSRYCYAAMRKATKLGPPKLPDVANKNDPAFKEIEKEEKAWKTVKSWSECLLSSQFTTMNELAEHITKNNLNSPVSSTSKQLFQKKTLQREKERKKLTVSSLLTLVKFDFFYHSYIFYRLNRSKNEERSASGNLRHRPINQHKLKKHKHLKRQ